VSLLPASLADRLFRWRQSDGTGTVVLGQRRIFILPSRAGLLFAAALAVMLLGAINYGLALGHALVFLLAGLGLTGMVHGFRNLVGLAVTPGRAEPVFAGETAHFPLHLANARAQPRLALQLAAGEGPPVHCDVPAAGQTRIALALPALRRGLLELPRVRLETRYPLGLFVAWCYPRPAMSCLVYPQPLATPLPDPAAAAHSGERRGREGQEDFAGFRPRQPADSLRHVAWKAAARGAPQVPLPVKLFQGGTGSELLLDWDSLAEAGDAERRLSILAGWVLAAEEAGIAYGLALPGVHIPPALGEAQRRRCLEALARHP